MFGVTFNCSAKPVAVRRLGNVFQIRFPGAPGKVALVQGVSPDAGFFLATPLPYGSFQITPQGAGTNDLTPQDQFLVVLF